MNSLKMKFFHLSLGEAEIFVCGVIRLEEFTVVDRFFVSFMVEELFLLNQENSYVMFN